MKFKLNPLEKKWILYDVGNSAFTLLVATLLPIYFNALAGSAGLSQANYLAAWGYATSLATILVALAGPVIGTVSDSRGRKKPLFIASILVGSAACLCLGFARQWLAFLAVFVIAKAGYSVSLIIYDSMLPDVTDPERMDTVSSQGYAWGYIGSCLPFVACLGLVLGADALHISSMTAMLLAFLLVTVWWIVMSLPLVKSYRQKHFLPSAPGAARRTFSQLWSTLKEIAHTRQFLIFLLAFFFYIDGVYTIIDMATAYGEALGLDQTGLLLALLVTQVVAFPSSIIIGRLSRRVSPAHLITVCICAYFGIAVFALFMSTQAHFWILAVCVGLFQGGIQALSRSYFTKIIPAEKSGEYFGILDICGKGASFLGTTVVSVVAQATGSANLGVGAIAIFFLIGLALFRASVRCAK